MTALEETLGYTFRNEELLRQALTHSSYWGGRHGPDYQRMEFLGDAVLEYTVSRYLYDTRPDMDEGAMTRARASLVREETLSRAAKRLNLGRYIRMGAGEKRGGGEQKPSILCDVFESVLAAILLDGGVEPAQRLVLSILREELDGDFPLAVDNKSKLQELLQSTGRAPEYTHVSTQGPPHAPVFQYQVWTDGILLGEGQGRTKQAAQQEAARHGLEKLKQQSGRETG